MNSQEWQARIDSDTLLNTARERSTWAAEMRQRCPECRRPNGAKHDSQCKLAGTQVVAQ